MILHAASQYETAEDEYNSVISAADGTENEESSPASSVLSLRYSSSPFDSHNSSSDSDESSHKVQPYLYEPEDSGTDTTESSDDETARERLNNIEWCAPNHPFTQLAEYGNQ